VVRLTPPHVEQPLMQPGLPPSQVLGSMASKGVPESVLKKKKTFADRGERRRGRNASVHIHLGRLSYLIDYYVEGSCEKKNKKKGNMSGEGERWGSSVRRVFLPGGNSLGWRLVILIIGNPPPYRGGRKKVSPGVENRGLGKHLVEDVPQCFRARRELPALHRARPGRYAGGGD